jgi:glycosyltransferase involved in cell wall biosynthesis
MNNKPNVLIFTEWFTPGFKAGGPIQSIANMVAQLTDYYNFYIITDAFDLGEEKPYTGVDFNVWNQIENVNVRYVHPKGKYKSEIIEILKERTYSKFYFNSVFSFRYTLWPLFQIRRLGESRKCVLAPRGMLGAGALSLKPLKKKLFIRAAKITGLFKDIIWHASTQNEANEIKAAFGNHIRVMEARNFTGISQSIENTAPSEPIRLVFVSRISRKKNLQYAIEILKQTNLAAVLDIYGPIEDAEYLNQCLNSAKNTKVGARYVGVLNRNTLFKELCSSHYFILPTLHENFGHGILEAMSAGAVPIISANTPWTNIEYINAGIIVPLDDIKKAAEKVKYTLQRPFNEWRELSENAQKFAREVAADKDTIQKHITLFGS